MSDESKPDKLDTALKIVGIGVIGLCGWAIASSINEASQEGRYWTRRYDRLKGRDDLFAPDGLEEYDDVEDFEEYDE